MNVFQAGGQFVEEVAMMRTALLATLVFFVMWFASRPDAAVLYVAPPPLGDDSNPGTEAQPFATEKHNLGEADQRSVHIVSDKLARSALQQAGNLGQKCAPAASGVTQGQFVFERQETGHRPGDRLWGKELAGTLSEAATYEVLIPNGKIARGVTTNGDPCQNGMELPVMRNEVEEL